MHVSALTVGRGCGALSRSARTKTVARWCVEASAWRRGAAAACRGGAASRAASRAARSSALGAASASRPTVAARPRPFACATLAGAATGARSLSVLTAAPRMACASAWGAARAPWAGRGTTVPSSTAAEAAFTADVSRRPSRSAMPQPLGTCECHACDEPTCPGTCSADGASGLRGCRRPSSTSVIQTDGLRYTVRQRRGAWILSRMR